MKLGNIIRKEESGMPQLEIIGVTARGEEKEHTYYLSPFRGYRFQVSENAHGEWDCGSSEVLGLGNIILATKSFEGVASRNSVFASNHGYKNGNAAKEIFHAMIITALTDHARMYKEGLSLSMDDRRTIDGFVDECYEYLTKVVEQELAKV